MIGKSSGKLYRFYTYFSLVLMIIALPALLIISFVLAFTENFSPGGDRWLFLFTLIPFLLELVLLIPFIRHVRLERGSVESVPVSKFVQTPNDSWKKVLSGLRILLFFLNVGFISWAFFILFDLNNDYSHKKNTDFYNDQRYLSEKVNTKTYRLKESGMVNEYTDITQSSDIGRRYLVTFGDIPNYQLFIMSPDFVSSAVNESVPTFFTSEDISSAQSLIRMSEELEPLRNNPKYNIQFSKKTEIHGMHVYWVVRHSESDNSVVFVQAFGKDRYGVQLLLHVDVSDSGYHNDYQAINSVENNPITQEILSAVF